MGSLDRPGEQTDPADGSRDRPSGIDRRNRGETEAEAAERLGLSNLTRGDYYDSQRAAAEAQEAAIKRRDAARDQAADQPEQRLEEPRSYWTEVPRFLSIWQRISDAWPYLSKPEREDKSIPPEKMAEAELSIETVSRSEPAISADIRRIEAENSSGGWLEGFEFRLKGPDRLMEKVVDQLSAETDRLPDHAVKQIPDAIRYTFCFEQDRYAEGFLDVKTRLESCGYEMYHCKNWWENPEYKAVNSRWSAPEGQRFEVQFHTRESFHAKHEVTHQAYERARSPLTGRAELADIEKFQTEVSSWIPVPRKVSEISDYRRKGY